VLVITSGLTSTSIVIFRFVVWRSTSFEHRICKYLGLGFMLVLPGLDISVIKSEKEKEREIRELIGSVGVRYYGRNIHWNLVYDKVNLNGRFSITLVDGQNIVKLDDICHFPKKKNMGPLLKKVYLLVVFMGLISLITYS